MVTVGRALGAWGDMVVTLRNGDKVELRSLERYKELKEYVLQRRDALAPATAAAAAGAFPLFACEGYRTQAYGMRLLRHSFSMFSCSFFVQCV